MNPLFFTSAIIALFVSLNTNAQSVSLSQGIEFYNKRAIGAVGIKAKPENINKAIQIFEKLLQEGTNKENVTVWLLKSYYYKGTYAVQETSQKKAVYNKGKALSVEALQQYPTNAKVHFWYIANLGKWAEVYGKIAAVREGVADILKKEAQAVIKYDPKYMDGGGYRIMGILHLEVPYIPFIMTWPDNEEGLEYVQKAYKYKPSLLENKRYLAKALIATKQKDKAKEVLKVAVTLKPRATNIVEDRNNLMECKKMLAKLG